jgi:hypothetical protein
MMDERRKSVRVESDYKAALQDCDGGFVRSCIVSNFCNYGAKITGMRSLAPHHPSQSPAPVSRRVADTDSLGVTFADNFDNVGKVAFSPFKNESWGMIRALRR